MTELYDKAREAARYVEQVPGAADVLVEQAMGLPQLLVRFECRRASARDTSTFGVPQFRIDSQFAAELCLAAVHRDASHDGNCPVLFHYLTLEVVDY